MAAAETNKARVERFIDECVTGDLDRIDDFVAPGFRGHGFPGFGEIRGPAEFRRFFESLRAAFSDFEARREEIVGEGDRVVLRATVTGRHTGDFLGIPATGTGIEVPGIRIFRLADGLIAEIWLVFDTFGLLRQLDALPDGIG